MRRIRDKITQSIIDIEVALENGALVVDTRDRLNKVKDNLIEMRSDLEPIHDTIAELRLKI